MMSIQPNGKHYLAIFIAILGWGFSVPFIEFGLAYIGPLPFLAYRFILATVVLTPIALIQKRQELGQLLQQRWLWVIGLAESLGLIFQYLGQQQGVPGGLAALLSLCFLLIVPFISPFIIGQKLEKYHLMAIITGFAGIIMISTEGDLNRLRGGTISLLGVLLLLSAAFGYALYIVATSRLTTIEQQDVDTFSLFYLVLLIVAASSTFATAMFSTFQPLPEELWIWLIGLAIFSTLIAFFSYFEALKAISANIASVLLLLQVLVPFAIDYVVLRRRYGIWIISGAGLIIIAMLIVVVVPLYYRRWKPSPKPQT